MQKFALCIDNVEDINKAVNGEVETIKLTMIDRAICEDPVNEKNQVIPYVTFYGVEAETGRVEFLQYQRAVKTTEGEEVGEKRLAGMTSVGFGGHIDVEEDISFTSKEENEEGQVVYEMTTAQLVETISKTAFREIREEIGVDVQSDMGVEINLDGIIFFKGREQSDVNKVHLCFGCLIPLEISKLNELKEKATIQENEISELGIMGVNFGEIAASFNVKAEIGRLIEELRTNHSLEDWSTIMVETVISGLCQMITMTIGWPELYKAHVAKVEEMHLASQVEESTEVVEDAVEDVEVV